MLFFLNDKVKTEIEPLTAKTFSSINWTEKDLENLIANNMLRLIPESQLMVLFQEKPFNEAADIYALDARGDLFIFELKRWKGQQENLLQVLRYGQIYGQYSYEQLQDMLRKYEKAGDIDLAEKHYEYFSNVLDEKLNVSGFNKDQHFVVITNGIDVDTRNSIKYWQDKGLKIESIVYRIYSIGSNNILEFNPYNPEGEVIIDDDQGYFIVNTNLTWSNVDYREMLSNSKAAAYGNRRRGIRNISKGDMVFLYHTRLGVIAQGTAIDNYCRTFNKGHNEEEFYIPLKLVWQIDPDSERDKAVRPWEINEKLGSQYSFRQTVFAIPENMAKVIENIAGTKTS